MGLPDAAPLGNLPPPTTRPDCRRLVAKNPSAVGMPIRTETGRPTTKKRDSLAAAGRYEYARPRRDVDRTAHCRWGGRICSTPFRFVLRSPADTTPSLISCVPGVRGRCRHPCGLWGCWVSLLFSLAPPPPRAPIVKAVHQTQNLAVMPERLAAGRPNQTNFGTSMVWGETTKQPCREAVRASFSGPTFSHHSSRDIGLM